MLRVYNAIYLGKPLPASTIAADMWLTTKIKTRIIASNGIDPSKIKVITENHIVYLLGIIPKDQADITVNIAHNTSGA